MICVVVRIEENLKRFRRDVHYEKCTLACLFWPYKFSDLVVKERVKNMLEFYKLTRLHLEREHNRTLLACISYAYRKYVYLYQEHGRLILALHYIGHRETGRDPGQEQ